MCTDAKCWIWAAVEGLPIFEVMDCQGRHIGPLRSEDEAKAVSAALNALEP